MGALVTLDLSADSPLLDQPWIITFGPLSDDEEWEPAVCGPYERPHALALAEAVVADEELMAVVEPLLPRVSVEEIRRDIAQARLAVDEPGGEGGGRFGDEAQEPQQASVPPEPDEVRAGFARLAARLTGGT
jgi:hypothetical protein